MNSSLVSVCIPTFNGEKYIAEAIGSILMQTYRSLELIVSDDDSKDNTIEIIGNIKKETNIPIHIYHHNPSSIGANWNNCMIHANGKYIKFLCQDDTLERTCVEEMVRIFEQDDGIGLVASKRKFIIENDYMNSTVQNWIETYQDLQIGLPGNETSDLLVLDCKLFKTSKFLNSPLNKIGEPSVVMFRKSLIDEVGLFRTDLKQILDYEYWYRILRKRRIVILNSYLAGFRIHPLQTTNVNRNLSHNDYRIYDKILINKYFFQLNWKNRGRLLIRNNIIYHLLKRMRSVFFMNKPR